MGGQLSLVKLLYIVGKKIASMFFLECYNGNMNTIYFLGGSSRSGKTTIFNKVIHEKPMIAVSSDALREGARNILLDESYLSISSLHLNGDVVFHRPGEGKDVSHTKQFSQTLTEDELTWKAVLGLINHYDRKDIPLVIEGIAVTPERVNDLKLKNLQIRAAFVGFTDVSYLETMIAHAHIKKDWIYKMIQESNGDDIEVRKWFAEQLEENKEMANKAKKYGYEFFSLDTNSFEDYCDTVTKYLVSSNA